MIRLSSAPFRVTFKVTGRQGDRPGHAVQGQIADDAAGVVADDRDLVRIRFGPVLGLARVAPAVGFLTRAKRRRAQRPRDRVAALDGPLAAVLDGSRHAAAKRARWYSGSLPAPRAGVIIQFPERLDQHVLAVPGCGGALEPLRGALAGLNANEAERTV